MKKLATLMVTLIVAATLTSILPFTHATNWQQVTVINGSGDQDTSTFTISAKEWRIVWSYYPESILAENYAFFGYNLFAESDQYSRDTFTKTGITEIGGTNYYHDGPNQFYLRIAVANLNNYQISVLEDMDTAPTATPSKTSNGSSNTVLTIMEGIIVLVAVALAVVVTLILRERRKKQPPSEVPSTLMTVHLLKSRVTRQA